MIDLALELQRITPVSVRFEQLVTNQDVADLQKDLLMQALRVAFPNVEYFSEENKGESKGEGNRSVSKFGGSPQEKNSKIIVRCQSCVVSFGSTLQASTLRKKIENELMSLEFSVLHDAKEELWNVEVSMPKMRVSVVATSDLERGHEISTGDVRLVRCETTQCGNVGTFENEEKARVEISELMGGVVSNTVESGRLIERNRVTRPVLIRPQDSVNLILSSGSNLQIRTKGRALSTGYRGGRVRIEIVDESSTTGRKVKIIDGIVTGINEAKYEF